MQDQLSRGCLQVSCHGIHLRIMSNCVLKANALTGTVFQPVFGRLSDIFGRKYTLLVTMSLFAIGNLAAGFSTTMRVH